MRPGERVVRSECEWLVGWIYNASNWDETVNGDDELAGPPYPIPHFICLISFSFRAPHLHQLSFLFSPFFLFRNISFLPFH